MPFVPPSRLIVSKGRLGLTGNIYFGLAEMHEMAFVLHFLRPSDLFVDIGANAGSYSVLASSVVGARTIAFEPVAETAAEMREQLRLNDILDRVEVRELALGQNSTIVRFYNNFDTVNRVVAESEPVKGAYREVRQSTLDIELEGSQPSLMKMDVEGYEYAIVKGASRILSNASLNAMIMEVHDGVKTYGVNPEELLALVRAHGFEPYSYDAIKRELTPVQFEQAHVDGLSDNLLMIRDLAAVRARLASAPTFTVYGVSF